MDIEYEAKFTNINKDELREKLKSLKARLTKPEFLQKRTAFFLPGKKDSGTSWLRIRDEGDKISVSLKIVVNGRIEPQKEIMIIVDNYEKARKVLTEIGRIEKAYKETKRETWKLCDVEVTIDEWPYLEPYVEIEGNPEQAVRKAAGTLGFDYKKAVFGAVDQLISKKWGSPESDINDEIKRIVFDEDNPYLKWKAENG
jgi:adenylate cyclase class 2